jgi:hypothetical protein
MGRPAPPEEIANAAFITGAALSVDGERPLEDGRKFEQHDIAYRAFCGMM